MIVMARRMKKTCRPTQGAKLTDLRKAANLSQTEFARLIGTSQSNVAFWELSDKPPRSDLLPKMAAVLGVKVETFFTDAAAMPKEVKNRPSGKVRLVFEEVSKLPRRQQEKVIEFVSAFVQQQNKN